MIIIITCKECKKLIHFDQNRCDSCLSKNLLKVRKRKYYFQGQAFSKKSWYQKMGNYLNFEKDTVTLRRTPDEIRIEYIRAFVLKNVKRTTFSMLILPCSLFLALSLILLWGGRIFQANVNFLNEAQTLFANFLGWFFFLMGSILLIKIIVFQDKVIVLGTGKRTKYKHISKKQYQGILNVFKKE